MGKHKKKRKKNNTSSSSLSSSSNNNNNNINKINQLKTQMEDVFYNTTWDKDNMMYKCIKKDLMENNGIFEIKQMITKEEAFKVIELAESTGFQETFQRETRECAFRKNGRLQIHSEKLAQILFDRIQMHLPTFNDKIKPIGLSDNFRLYKYTPGQAFGPHIDESVRTNAGYATLYTLLMYLNDDGLTGGETTFYTSDSYPGRNMNIALKYKPKLGNGLVHMHGDQCLLHEGNEVKGGIKYLLRTDIAYSGV